MKKSAYLALFLSLFIILAPFFALANNIKNEKSFYLSPEEIVSGNLYIISQKIAIDGEVKGDLIALTQDLSIKGRIEGDVIALSSKTDVQGEINGSIRLAGEELYINGQIARNVNFVGKRLVLGDSAQVGWDLLNSTLSTKIFGLVNGNVFSANEELIITGEIKGHLHYSDKTNLSIEEDADIAGNLYSLEKNQENRKELFSWWQILIYKIIATFLIYLLIIIINKKWLLSAKSSAKHKPWRSLLFGLLFFITTPLIALLLLLTFVGAPLALIIILLWLISILIAKAFASFYIGTEIINFLPEKYKISEWLSILIGATILFTILLIPFTNIYLSILINAFILGSIIINIKK